MTKENAAKNFKQSVICRNIQKYKNAIYLYCSSAILLFTPNQAKNNMSHHVWKIKYISRQPFVQRHNDSFVMGSYFLQRTSGSQNPQLRLLSKSSKMHLMLGALL